MLKTFNHIHIKALLVAALLAAPGTASADRYEISVGTTARHLHSTTVDVVSPNDRHTMFSMTVGAELDRQLLKTGIQVELGFEAGSIEGKIYDRMRSDTTLETGTVGARLRWDLGSGLYGFGRAAIGVSRVHFELRDSFGSSFIRDRGYAGVFDTGGGFDYVLVRDKRRRKGGFSMGLRLDMGYTAASPVNLEAKPGRLMQEGAISIPTTAADLGSLNTSSWNFRLALVARF